MGGQEPEELQAIKDRIMRERPTEEAVPVRVRVFNSHLGESERTSPHSKFVNDLMKFYGL